MYPALKCHCKNNHWWALIVPGYWFAIPRCPECGCKAISLTWGGLQESLFGDYQEYKSNCEGKPELRKAKQD